MILVTLIIIREIVFIVALLAMPVYFFFSAYNERKQRKQLSDLVIDIADRLLEKADDEKPNMQFLDLSMSLNCNK